MLLLFARLFVCFISFLPVRLPLTIDKALLIHDIPLIDFRQQTVPPIDAPFDDIAFTSVDSRLSAPTLSFSFSFSFSFSPPCVFGFVFADRCTYA